MPLLDPAPCGHPAVSLVTHASDAACDALISSMALELAVCRAAGAQFAGVGPTSPSRPVQFFDVTKEAEDLRSMVQQTCSRLGIDPTTALPLTVRGRNHTPKGYLYERLAAERGGLIIFAAAAATAGVGYAHEGRDAWGLYRPWGPGRRKGALGSQLTHAREWGVEFLIFMNFANPRTGCVDRDEMLANADSVTDLLMVEGDEDYPLRAYIEEGDREVKITRPDEGCPWRFAESLRVKKSA